MYIERADVRAQGFAEAKYSNDMVDEAIETACAYIDRITGRWFEARNKTLLLDGDGTDLLQLHIPILSITSVETRQVLNAWTLHSLDEFAVYAGEDNNSYPRIRFMPYGVYCRFPLKPQSVRIVGSFGYLENDATPVMIKRAALELSTAYLGTLASGEPQDRARKDSFIEEDTEYHRYKLADRMAGGNYTGISSVDRILARYKNKTGKVSFA
jgi:hypothetical protein